jgi:hypothetical protein
MMTEPRPLPDRISGFRSTAINGILDYLESLRPINSRTVRHSWMPGGVVSEAAAPSAEFDLSKLDYWYSITGVNTLHVNGGKVPILGQNITVAAADVDCPGTDTGALYVYLEVQVAGKTGTIVTTAVSSEPVTELGVMRKVLYQLHKSSGSIVIEAIRITDPWVLPLFVE